MAKFCPNCGSEMIDEAAMCVKCGTMVGENNTNKNNEEKPTASGEKKKGLPAWAIVLIVLGGLGLLVVIAIIVFAVIGIALFAFSTILGWEYHGEKAFEYLMGTHKFNMIYRIIFSLVAYVGATQTLELVWNFSDIANALMAIPNLICMLLLSGEIAKDVKEFQKTIEEEKAGK